MERIAFEFFHLTIHRRFFVMFNRLLYASAIACIVVIGCYLTWHFWPNDPPPDDTDVVMESSRDATLVSLTESKLKAAAIRIATASESVIQPTRTIAGRLDYDLDRHVAVKSACKGIITDLRVRPGDQVHSGEVVGVISSPDVGIARSNVHTRLAAVRLAEAEWNWRKKICSGVEELVSLVRDGKTPEEIEKRLQDQSLGEYRQKLISAYTRSRQAMQVAANTRDAASRGAISGLVQLQRETEQQASDAATDAVIEQSMFEVRQSCQQAQAALATENRQLEVSLQQLNMLLGLAAKPVTVEELGKDQPDTLSEVQLVSPIDGTVEERLLSTTERVDEGESIFTIADTEHLWAVADIRERDWSAINVDVGQEVAVTTPAIPGEVYNGRILIVGRRVDPATGAAPLIAALKSSDARLRPGLFIRMIVPAGPQRMALCVPEPAVVVHEGRSFVFVPESEVDFRRVDVEVGETVNDMIEILAGLKPGDQVAVTGVFKLKSELLLAREEQ